jgi:hypothetical protein
VICQEKVDANWFNEGAYPRLYIAKDRAREMAQRIPPGSWLATPTAKDPKTQPPKPPATAPSMPAKLVGDGSGIQKVTVHPVNKPTTTIDSVRGRVGEAIEG